MGSTMAGILWEIIWDFLSSVGSLDLLGFLSSRVVNVRFLTMCQCPMACDFWLGEFRTQKVADLENESPWQISLVQELLTCVFSDFGLRVFE